MAFDKNQQGVEEVDSHLVRVKVDEHVIDPESELAVQVPDEVANRDNVLDVHKGDAPEDIFAAASEEAAAEREAQSADEAEAAEREAALEQREADVAAREAAVADESKAVDQPVDDKDQASRDQS